MVRPVATASDAHVEQGELVLFTTTFSDGPATWIFGDGARTTGTRVWHRFRRPGTFSVILS